MNRVFSKATVTMGAGVGIGLVAAAVSKKYDAIVPVIGEYLPVPWGNYSTIGLMLGGLGALIVGRVKLLYNFSQSQLIITNRFYAKLIIWLKVV